MKQKNLVRFEKIPQPGMEKLVEILKSPSENVFIPGTGKSADREMTGSLENGIRLENQEFLPETALVSLKRMLAAKNVTENNAGYPVVFERDIAFEHEEYCVKVTPERSEIKAADDDGFRRAIYFFEDRLREAEGKIIHPGIWRKKPFIKIRISRCFFGPTYRPPKRVDELSDDVDYYPENYLDKLAHEGINGLWITMYFRDIPTTICPHFGQGFERRAKKLCRIIAKCSRYGIRIYVYFSEPKGFGNNHFTIRESDMAGHPEVICRYSGGKSFFNTSSDSGKQYLSEALTRLFSAAPELGGILNIMFGEDNGSCVSARLSSCFGTCPVCDSADIADQYFEYAKTMSEAIHKVAPNAEFIGWFYAPGQRDGSKLMQDLLHAIEKWPDDCGLMFNFESGGENVQLGKERNVFDYSLAFIGPSELFRKMTNSVAKPAAKLQVGCSHEDASVPFIPVPSNLYRKYKFMYEHGIGTVLQCWYFGNYPGLMNKAAGELSFEPFPESEDAFLQMLAFPEWGKHASDVVASWKHFAEGYSRFPSNLAFAWYGPLHQSIIWPLYLFPVDKPMPPSWLLNDFPNVAGDRIGECLIYQHTLPEAIELCEEMLKAWKRGTEILAPLKPIYENCGARMVDIRLAEAIKLQIASALNVLKFYALREEMFYEKKENRPEMREIVMEEIRNSSHMKKLCEHDVRLGYHSEVEGYLFHPAKLESRMRLLEELLQDDFIRFDLTAEWIDEYTGRTPHGKIARCGSCRAERYEVGNSTGMFWSPWHDETNLHIEFTGFSGISYELEVEPCRLWPPMVLHIDANGVPRFYGIIFRKEPELSFEYGQNGSRLVTIPFSAFDGYRRDRFPMRINVRTKDEYHAWVEDKPWPFRLLHEDYNPKAAGWLIFDDLPAEEPRRGLSSK